MPVEDFGLARALEALLRVRLRLDEQDSAFLRLDLDRHFPTGVIIEALERLRPDLQEPKLGLLEGWKEDPEFKACQLTGWLEVRTEVEHCNELRDVIPTGHRLVLGTANTALEATLSLVPLLDLSELKKCWQGRVTVEAVNAHLVSEQVGAKEAWFKQPWRTLLRALIQAPELRGELAGLDELIQEILNATAAKDADQLLQLGLGRFKLFRDSRLLSTATSLSDARARIKDNASLFDRVRNLGEQDRKRLQEWVDSSVTQEPGLQETAERLLQLDAAGHAELPTLIGDINFDNASRVLQRRPVTKGVSGGSGGGGGGSGSGSGSGGGGGGGGEPKPEPEPPLSLDTLLGELSDSWMAAADFAGIDAVLRYVLKNAKRKVDPQSSAEGAVYYRCNLPPDLGRKELRFEERLKLSLCGDEWVRIPESALGEADVRDLLTDEKAEEPFQHLIERRAAVSRCFSGSGSANTGLPWLRDGQSLWRALLLDGDLRSACAAYLDQYEKLYALAMGDATPMLRLLLYLLNTDVQGESNAGWVRLLPFHYILLKDQQQIHALLTELKTAKEWSGALRLVQDHAPKLWCSNTYPTFDLVNHKLDALVTRSSWDSFEPRDTGSVTDQTLSRRLRELVALQRKQVCALRGRPARMVALGFPAGLLEETLAKDPMTVDEWPVEITAVMGPGENVEGLLAADHVQCLTLHKAKVREQLYELRSHRPWDMMVVFEGGGAPACQLSALRKGLLSNLAVALDFGFLGKGKPTLKLQRGIADSKHVPLPEDLKLSAVSPAQPSGELGGFLDEGFEHARWQVRVRQRLGSPNKKPELLGHRESTHYQLEVYAKSQEILRNQVSLAKAKDASLDSVDDVLRELQGSLLELIGKTDIPRSLKSQRAVTLAQRELSSMIDREKYAVLCLSLDGEGASYWLRREGEARAHKSDLLLLGLPLVPGEPYLLLVVEVKAGSEGYERSAVDKAHLQLASSAVSLAQLLTPANNDSKLARQVRLSHLMNDLTLVHYQQMEKALEKSEDIERLKAREDAFNRLTGVKGDAPEDLSWRLGATLFFRREPGNNSSFNQSSTVAAQPTLKPYLAKSGWHTTEIYRGDKELKPLPSIDDLFGAAEIEGLEDLGVALDGADETLQMPSDDGVEAASTSLGGASVHGDASPSPIPTPPKPDSLSPSQILDKQGTGGPRTTSQDTSSIGVKGTPEAKDTSSSHTSSPADAESTYWQGQPSASSAAVPGRPVVWLGHHPSTLESVSWDPFGVEHLRNGAPERLTNRHLMIVGSSGSGKTQTLKSLIAGLADQGVPLLILDYKDDFVSPEFLERIGARLHDAITGLPVNPLVAGIDPGTGQVVPILHLSAVANVLEQVFSLGPQQRANLDDALEATYCAAGVPLTPYNPSPSIQFPSFNDLRSHIEATGDLKLFNRVKSLFRLGVFSGAGESFEELLGGTTVLRLKRLGESEKKAVGALLLQSVYYELLRMGSTEDLRTAVVIDEAHRVANTEPMQLLLKEARGFGASVMISSQELADFDQSLIGNAGSHIVMQSTEAPRDAAKLVVGAANAPQVAEQVRVLKPFHALLRNNHHRNSVLVRIKPFYVRERERVQGGEGEPLS